MDQQVLRAVAMGTPSLTLLILGMLGFWIYRFWILGWTAFPGNLRILALIAGGLGTAGVIFGPLWTFGVRSRKKAAMLLVIATIAFLVFNLF